MKSFECGTLVPGCRWHTSAENEADLVSRVVHHLHDDHGEQMVRPNMIEEIKARITDLPSARRQPAA